MFQFIEFLHSNIENFNQYNGLIKELEQLDKKRNELKPEQNYKDKLQYSQVLAQIEIKFKTLQDNTANLIKGKVMELNVCSFDNEPKYSFNGIETEIQQLKKSFSKKDLPEIFKHKRQYLEYRSQTHGTFLSLQFFFDDLDKIAKRLFDYFKDTDQNEFESFETKAIRVDSVADAIKGFKQGQSKFSLPDSVLFKHRYSDKPQNKEQNPEFDKDIRYWLTSFSDQKEQDTHKYKSFQWQIENNGCFIINSNGETVKIYTPELAVIFTSNKLPVQNMDEQSETEINGRDYLETYIEAYKEGEQYFENEYKVPPGTLYGNNAEKYVKDIHINFFHIRHTEANEGWSYVKKQYPVILTYKAIREFGYYSGIVNKVEEQLKKYPRLFSTFDKCEHNVSTKPIDGNQKPKPELDEVLSQQITHPKKVEIANAIKEKYSSYKGKDFKILYEALLKLDLFPKKGKRSLFFRCLQKEGYNINNFQILEDKHFKTGYTNRKGEYEKSEDEKQRDTIIEYLKTIIETK
ncbi:hypothetical protein [Aestuariivivens sediminicola]|uniref:hypothetical protein n=1 Tax=Aestuariivivens sediminicola TaxID=2913560 RepID=UPI001F57609D|nr:hypothetical protein [Aestuariivivens sediminicola]